jgi:hypothetical protein
MRIKIFENKILMGLVCFMIILNGGVFKTGEESENQDVLLNINQVKFSNTGLNYNIGDKPLLFFDDLSSTINLQRSGFGYQIDNLYNVQGGESQLLYSAESNLSLSLGPEQSVRISVEPKRIRANLVSDNSFVTVYKAQNDHVINIRSIAAMLSHDFDLALINQTESVVGQNSNFHTVRLNSQLDIKKTIVELGIIRC